MLGICKKSFSPTSEYFPLAAVGGSRSAALVGMYDDPSNVHLPQDGEKEASVRHYLDSPWKAAEAYHFLLLAQRQLYEGANFFFGLTEKKIIEIQILDVLEGRWTGSRESSSTKPLTLSLVVFPLPWNHERFY